MRDAVNGWLGGLFARENVDRIVAALVASQGGGGTGARESIRARLTDVEARLRRLQAMIDSLGDVSAALSGGDIGTLADLCTALDLRIRCERITGTADMSIEALTRVDGVCPRGLQRGDVAHLRRVGVHVIHGTRPDQNGPVPTSPGQRGSLSIFLYYTVSSSHARHHRAETSAEEAKRTMPSSQRCEHPWKDSSLTSSRGESSTQTTVDPTAPTVTPTTPPGDCSSSESHGVLNNVLSTQPSQLIN